MVEPHTGGTAHGSAEGQNRVCENQYNTETQSSLFGLRSCCKPRRTLQDTNKNDNGRNSILFVEGQNLKAYISKALPVYTF